MCKFKFQDSIPLISSKDLSKGLFLWIWQPDKLPPHLGISKDGLYFSLLYERKQESLSIESQMEIINRKKLSMIWQEITSESADFSQIFSSYISCAIDSSSCIQPILDGLNIKTKGGVLFDLLDELEKSDSLGKEIHLNLPENFKGIKKYNRSEVEIHLFKYQG
jgi:hypothetical protein